MIDKINIGKTMTLYYMKSRLRTIIFTNLYFNIAIYSREGERYYKKLLLNHIRGPTSFEDLLIVNEIYYETFKEAIK